MSYEFAKLYDQLMVSADYESWYFFLKEIFSEYKIKNPDILELGCGTGEFLKRLKKDKYRVMGVDISSEMLAVAREKFVEESLDIPLVEQDMMDLTLPVGFDFIFSFFDTMNYLLSKEELEKTFERVSTHLDCGGYFLFDVVGREFMEETFTEGILVEESDELTRIWYHDYIEEENIDTVQTIFFVKEKSGKYKKIEDYYEKMIFNEDEIKKAASKTTLNFIKKIEREDLAGKRSFYLFKQDENK